MRRVAYSKRAGLLLDAHNPQLAHAPSPFLKKVWSEPATLDRPPRPAASPGFWFSGVQTGETSRHLKILITRSGNLHRFPVCCIIRKDAHPGQVSAAASVSDRHQNFQNEP